jgi:hypothetical protein
MRELVAWGVAVAGDALAALLSEPVTVPEALRLALPVTLRERVGEAVLLVLREVLRVCVPQTLREGESVALALMLVLRLPPLEAEVRALALPPAGPPPLLPVAHCEGDMLRLAEAQ